MTPKKALREGSRLKMPSRTPFSRRVHLKIESYDLNLDIDFPRARVSGTVGITVTGAKSPLILDSSTLRVRSVKVNGRPGRFFLDKGRSKLRVYAVPRRRSLVEIKYDKQVSDASIFGLYKARHGKEYILATDLEPAEARTVFPCVDEPLYKAVFRVRITTQKGLEAISNTPAERVELTEDGRTRYVFEQTPRMSTYLLFFAVGEIEELKIMSGSIEIIGATRRGIAKDSRFALEVVAGVVDDYQKYFDVPYPLEKLHVVALPEYHTGAMENWGAIASRESRVLINDQSSFSERVLAAGTMTHEVGHQWFGDLVTMRWWDDLWLNESFATLMEYKMMGRLHPEYEAWNLFLRDETFPAIVRDALTNTHPVQVKVRTVEEATHFFDIISYNKGASILRMLEAYAGEEAFRKGVSTYLKKFSYANATGRDLWKSLGDASKLPIQRVARAWLTMPGFPVVKVDSSEGGTRVTQSQFRMSGTPRGLWPIPIDLLVDGQRKSTFLSKKSAVIPGAVKSELVVNAGRTGFYSVLYDEEGWERIGRGFPRLSSVDRAGTLTDLFLFLQAGLIEPELYFRFISLVAQAPDPLSSDTAVRQLRELRALADEAPVVQEAYRAFYPPLADRIGETPRPGEPEVMGATREALFSEYVKVDDAYAKKLSSRFGEYGHVDPNLREAVAVAYAVTNGESAKGPLLRLVKSMDSEVDRGKIYVALSSFADPGLIEETLDLVMSGEVSRSDSVYPLVSASVNPHARDVYWAWLSRNYEKLRDLYGNSQQFYLFMGICIPNCGVARVGDVEKFLSGKRFKEGGSTFARALELLKIYSRLRRRLLDAEKHH